MSLIKIDQMNIIGSDTHIIRCKYIFDNNIYTANMILDYYCKSRCYNDVDIRSIDFNFKSKVSLNDLGDIMKEISSYLFIEYPNCDLIRYYNSNLKRYEKIKRKGMI